VIYTESEERLAAIALVRAAATGDMLACRALSPTPEPPPWLALAVALLCEAANGTGLPIEDILDTITAAEMGWYLAS
jgi:hypothetical protein